MRQIENLLEKAINRSTITCADCNNLIEPDAEECHCGWVNPLVEAGLI